jgi:hypothetical protein
MGGSVDAVTGAGDRSTSKIPVQSFTHEVTMIPLLSALIFAVFVGQAHAQTAAGAPGRRRKGWGVISVRDPVMGPPDG